MSQIEKPNTLITELVASLGNAFFFTGGGIAKNIGSKLKTGMERLGNYSKRPCAVMREFFAKRAAQAFARRNREAPIVILSGKHTLFIAHLLIDVLQQEKQTAVIQTSFFPEFDGDRLHFVICPQAFSILPRNFVAVQLEQSKSSDWFDVGYLDLLRRARAILDYSQSNVQFLVSQGLEAQRVFHLPISPLADYPAFLERQGYRLSGCRPEIEVLFYGDAGGERRRQFLNQLGQRFKLRIVRGVYGEKLARLVLAAKVVVNIHYYEDALLETTRLGEVLSLGTPVISEKSRDMDGYLHWSDAVKFTPVGDIESMMHEVNFLLNNSEGYAVQKAAIGKLPVVDKSFYRSFLAFWKTL